MEDNKLLLDDTDIADQKKNGKCELTPQEFLGGIAFAVCPIVRLIHCFSLARQIFCKTDNTSTQKKQDTPSCTPTAFS